MPQQDTRPAHDSATLDDALAIIADRRDVCYRTGDHDSGKRWEHALDALESAMDLAPQAENTAPRVTTRIPSKKWF